MQKIVPLGKNGNTKTTYIVALDNQTDKLSAEWTDEQKKAFKDELDAEFGDKLSSELSNFLRVVDKDWDESTAENGVFYFVKEYA